MLHRPGESEGLHGVHRARELRGGDDQGERAGLLEAGHPGAFRLASQLTAQCWELAGTTTVMSAHPLSWARRQALELHVSSHLRSPRWGVISILKEEILRLREMSTWLPTRTGVSPCTSRIAGLLCTRPFFYLFLYFLYLFIFHCTESSLLLGFFSSCGKQMLLLMQCSGFSWQWLLLWSPGSRHMGSAVVAPRLHCPSACWFFP